jgi:hypothetical protein
MLLGCVSSARIRTLWNARKAVMAEGDIVLSILSTSKGYYFIKDLQANFRGEALIEETLRQVCLRNNYGSKKLIHYLTKMKKMTENASAETGWDSNTLTRFSWKTVSDMKLNRVNLEKCIENSFKPYFEQGKSHKEAHVLKPIPFWMIIFY